MPCYRLIVAAIVQRFTNKDRKCRTTITITIGNNTVVDNAVNNDHTTINQCYGNFINKSCDNIINACNDNVINSTNDNFINTTYDIFIYTWYNN
ncbi:hypothetical protein DPMN_161066 [Dreissena polymorpha]|uniref:Uncharacterized protein n=1 Tax=Dreissena polymorpha TaxID=45954 RepID=A0A9D4IT48_DREPO|nr:hypothetical protein DPMN_161066 [Dreissena polymorpha]